MMRRNEYDPDDDSARADRASRLARLLMEQADAEIERAGGIEIFRDRRRRRWPPVLPSAGTETAKSPATSLFEA